MGTPMESPPAAVAKGTPSSSIKRVTNSANSSQQHRHRSAAASVSPTLVGLLIAGACTFSAGFNFAFFLMTSREHDHRQHGPLSHLPRMEDFVSSASSSSTSHSFAGGGGGADKPRAKQQIAAVGVKNPGAAGGPLLTCDKYGGPNDELASEMVYWKEIPADAEFVSPFKHKEGEEPKYLTFEPDVGGWNNIRMAMETVVALAHAMGRTLVMPAKKEMYLLAQEEVKHDNSLHFGDFFDLEALSEEHSGLEIISMEQFMEGQAMTGRLRDKDTGLVKFPPGNRTNWDGLARNHEVDDVARYLRSVAVTPDWKDESCMASFPSHPGNTEQLQRTFDSVMEEGLPSLSQMSRGPLPVNASTRDRMRELSLGRKLCVYDTSMQEAHLVHFRVETEKGIRLLVHFYAFLYFEDWRHDLHLKRLVRDHLRYLDELQCAAARVVAAVRDRARKKDVGKNSGGIFDTMHIRRGDFQYLDTRLDAPVLYNLSRADIPEGTTLYIATDERDRSFFAPFAQHYDVCFLGDFAHLIPNLSKNYYGMLDQLIASRGRTFYGTFYSTFTGYINRMRGYHADQKKLAGHEEGLQQSYYFYPKHRQLTMRKYAPVHKAFWLREFPAAWRNIDRGTTEL